MNTVITNEPHEILEIRPTNDAISLVQKRRASVMDEWNIKVIILNEREYEAVANYKRSPRLAYQVAGRR